MARQGKNSEALWRTRTGMLTVVLIVAAALVGSIPGSNAAFAAFGTNSSSPLPFRVGYYSQSCPNAESIVSKTLSARFLFDVKAPAQIIRLLFHECFVSGCDGSLLVNSTATNQGEQAAPPNLSVAGYDVIKTAKTALEVACPGVVSCADIEALMTRDAIVALGGPTFQIPTGRLDTRAVTTARNATSTLPNPSGTAQQSFTAFAAKGFSVLDMVTLLGGHTVGAAFCQTFSYRLYNFQSTNLTDPSMDPKLVITLKTICPNPNTPVTPDPTVALDQGVNSINVIDNSYYQQLLLGHGILAVDQSMATSNFTKSYVTAYAGNGSAPATLSFGVNFANAIIKLSTLDVITGNTTLGSIRKNCAILN